MIHTKEPWTSTPYGTSIYTLAEVEDGRTYGYGCGPHFVCELNDGEYHQYADIKEQIATAERIVSCVNALAGIRDPQAFMADLRICFEDNGTGMTERAMDASDRIEAALKAAGVKP